MISQKPRGFLSKSMWIVTGVLFIGVTLGPRVAATATVSELVAQAKKEGALNATVSSAMKGTTIKKLTAAFKKRFGLNIKVQIVAIADTRYYPKALAATEAGAAPTYDSLEGSVLNQMIITNAGGVQRVEGWEALLAEINPLVRSGKVRPAQISPEPYSGFAFHYMSRVKAMLYNTKIISRDKLPKTHAELGDPKYKDKFVQPPFTAHWDIGLLAFPEISKKKWLEVIGKAGKNSGAIGYPRGNLQRLLIGEYPFGLIQIDNYLAAKRKDPKVPLGFSYFKDYNGAPSTFYNVRKGAKHPAAGTLFALWVGSPDAKAIWQTDINGSQFSYGESEIDKKVKGYLDAQGATTQSYLGSKKGVELLKWMVTKEGRKYRSAISKAIRGGKGRKKRR